jgi:hypothetical protein
MKTLPFAHLIGIKSDEANPPKAKKEASTNKPDDLAAQILAAGKKARGETPETEPVGVAAQILAAARKARGEKP